MVYKSFGRLKNNMNLIITSFIYNKIQFNSQHKINPELNFSLITIKVLFTLHLLVTANHGLKITSALWLSAMFLVYCSRMLSWSPLEVVYMLCPCVDDSALVKRCFIFYTLLFSQCVQRKKANLNLEAKAPLRCRLS
jgi:hypothetical protein